MTDNNNTLSPEGIKLLTREQLGWLSRGELFEETGLYGEDIHNLLDSDGEWSTTGKEFCKHLLEVAMEDRSLYTGMKRKKKKKQLKNTFMNHEKVIVTEIQNFIEENQSSSSSYSSRSDDDSIYKQPASDMEIDMDAEKSKGTKRKKTKTKKKLKTAAVEELNDTSPSSREDHSSTTSESFSRKRSRQSTEEQSSKSIRIMVYNEETKKMTVVFTSLNDTIGSLKSKIESQENIPLDLQSLLWKDNEPEDSERLCECNITEESLLFLRKSFITLTILNEETHSVTSLDVNPNNTIKSIKEKMKGQDSSVQADKQFLVWKGDELKDDRKLSEYDVEKDSFFVLKKHTVNIFDSKDQKVIILKSMGLTDTVENIKKKIESQESIPVDEQYLFYKGHEVEDDKRLSDLNLEKDSMLVLKKFLVRLRIQNEENQENMILYAERDDTIRTLKNKLQAQENISTDQRYLRWTLFTLQDDRKLSDYNFKRDSLLVLKKPLIKLTILDDETQKAIILHHVELTDTVEHIKKKIESQESIPVDQQYLFYKGHEVEDDKDLSDLNLEKDSMLVLKKSIVRLKIRNEENQENMILYAERDDTIRSIKKKLEDQENISTDQRYLRCTIFTLYDDRRLSDYTFVKKDSLLVLKRTKMKLTILDEETQKVMTVCVYPDNTIKVVKNEIEKEKNIPADHQCLFLKENELQDGDKLSEHNIEQDSLLILKKVLVRVNILNDNTQKLTSFNVHPYDTVKTIKRKIEDQANVPFDIQCLMWKDNELQDSKKLSEYDLEEDSLLVLKQCISL